MGERATATSSAASASASAALYSTCPVAVSFSAHYPLLPMSPLSPALWMWSLFDPTYSLYIQVFPISLCMKFADFYFLGIQVQIFDLG